MSTQFFSAAPLNKNPGGNADYPDRDEESNQYCRVYSDPP
jgi:hypothetical protein